MVQIMLNDDQTRAFQAANGSEASVVDSRGNLLGHLRKPPFSRDEVAEAVKRADAGGPWYTIQEVLDHLSKLEK